MNTHDKNTQDSTQISAHEIEILEAQFECF